MRRRRIMCLHDKGQEIGIVKFLDDGQIMIGFWCRKCSRHIFFSLEDLKNELTLHRCSL